jgi:hypothetical protein
MRSPGGPGKAIDQLQAHGFDVSINRLEGHPSVPLRECRVTAINNPSSSPVSSSALSTVYVDVACPIAKELSTSARRPCRNAAVPAAESVGAASLPAPASATADAVNPVAPPSAPAPIALVVDEAEILTPAAPRASEARIEGAPGIPAAAMPPNPAVPVANPVQAAMPPPPWRLPARPPMRCAPRRRPFRRLRQRRPSVWSGHRPRQLRPRR